MDMLIRSIHHWIFRGLRFTEALCGFGLLLEHRMMGSDWRRLTHHLRECVCDQSRPVSEIDDARYMEAWPGRLRDGR